MVGFLTTALPYTHVDAAAVKLSGTTGQDAATHVTPDMHHTVKSKTTCRSTSKLLRVLNIFGTESWLNTEVKDNEDFPPGFNIYRKARPLTTGGGVFLAINSEVISSSVQELDSKCEIVWAKLGSLAKKQLIWRHTTGPQTMTLAA